MKPRNRMQALFLDYGTRHIGHYLHIALILLILMLSRSVVLAQDKNTYCPVTTSELAEDQFFVDYQGQRIHFCCNKCKKDFLSDPETYLVNLPDTSLPSEEHNNALLSAGHQHEHSDTPEHEHDHSETVSESTTPPPADSEPHAHIDDKAHDHATDHGETTNAVTILGKFHPMVTHFPIALVISALLFSGLGSFLKIQIYDIVSVYCVYVAALSGIATVLLGLAAGASASYPSFLAGYLSAHRLVGLLTGAMTLITAYLGRRQLQTRSARAIWIYRGALLTNAILVGITGHLGATLVFGPDHFDF